ncbi:MAG: GH3 auxin-responsive promoter family protein, partial [Verrucomicrobia bacterium]|nr:GH3 auxin-responsive promoter family protein [Verrucomicrobiota bacterium]
TSLTGQVRGCHEWWVELKPGTVDTPTGPQIASELDPELQRLNADYAARRRAGTLDGPRVRLVMPGLFEHSLRHQNRWGGQHKLARCANDRQLADQLAQISRFARD